MYSDDIATVAGLRLGKIGKFQSRDGRQALHEDVSALQVYN